MSKMLDALKRLQAQGASPASMPTINNTVGQIDAVRDVATAVDQAIAETEQRLRDEYEKKLAERDRQLAERQSAESGFGREKQHLERQLAQLQATLDKYKLDASAHDELQAELQANLERRQADADRLRQEDEAPFLQEQKSLQQRLQELDDSQQQLIVEAATLAERLERKEAELVELQNSMQATSTVVEESLRTSLSAELTQQADEFARKEAELQAALVEAQRRVESQQHDLAEIVRLRAEEKAKFEKSRVVSAENSPANVASIEPVERPPVATLPATASTAESPSLLLRSFASAVPRPHLTSYEEQTLVNLQDARINERYERLAQPSTKPSSVLFLSADGGDDAHQAGFHAALAASREDRQVLIIDGDVHGKQLSNRLGMRDSLGFYEVVRRETKWTERVVGLKCGQIDFLPAGRSLYTVSRSDLESAQAVWRELSEVWPLIVLVGEHPGAVSTELYGVLCQSIYLTACLGRATKDDVKAASKRIASIGGRIEAAVAMNAKLN